MEGHTVLKIPYSPNVLKFSKWLCEGVLGEGVNHLSSLWEILQDGLPHHHPTLPEIKILGGHLEPYFGTPRFLFFGKGKWSHEATSPNFQQGFAVAFFFWAEVDCLSKQVWLCALLNFWILCKCMYTLAYIRFNWSTIDGPRTWGEGEIGVVCLAETVCFWYDSRTFLLLWKYFYFVFCCSPNFKCILQRFLNGKLFLKRLRSWFHLNKPFHFKMSLQVLLD